MSRDKQIQTEFVQIVWLLNMNSPCLINYIRIYDYIYGDKCLETNRNRHSLSRWFVSYMYIHFAPQNIFVFMCISIRTNVQRQKEIDIVYPCSLSPTYTFTLSHKLYSCLCVYLYGQMSRDKRWEVSSTHHILSYLWSCVVQCVAVCCRVLQCIAVLIKF